MGNNVFSVPVFLVVFRETLETSIIVSILLAFLKQTLTGANGDVSLYKKLRKQVWLGTLIGFGITLIVACAIIGVFYGVGRNSWSAHENYYEGSFALIASLIISIIGIALLRIGRMQEKWRVKLAQALEAPMGAKMKKGSIKQFCEKYALFILPFVTILREGIEAIIFVTGVSFSTAASAIPLAVIVGLLVGSFVGYLLYKSGSSTKIKLFLILSTCLLYLIAAGLFSRAVWFFEAQEWNKAVGGDAAETGAGPGSYDITKSVWHVNCCSPLLNGGGGWGVLNAIFGWTNSATFGSVIAYNVYWIVLTLSVAVLRYKEVKGHYPFFKAKKSEEPKDERYSDELRGTENPIQLTSVGNGARRTSNDLA